MSATNDEKTDVQDRMLGSVPGAPAVGRGPATDGVYSRHEYHHPAAGWGAARSVGHVLESRGTPTEGVRALFVMNQENGGFDCPGCAWPDDPSGLHLDICENGVKHVTWELTRKQVGREFFAEHTVSELEAWSDYDLENAGRLAEPMRYDAASDRYVPVSWDDAFNLVGDALRGLGTSHEAAFYTPGRLSNEATFLYQLWVREFALTVRRGSRRSAGGRSHPAKRTPAPSADRPPSPLPGRARPG
jgi:anaerobic selenocysteine-containing dehydrogenase